MKRILILLPLLAGLAMPVSAGFSGFSGSVCAVSELPWSTVLAVLKKAAELRAYTCEQLVSGYEAGWVTVAQSGSGYEVRIVVDGIVEIIVIDNI
jgi:hypothetical protein